MLKPARLLYPLSFLLVSCAPLLYLEPIAEGQSCVTACGIHVFNSEDCDGFQAAEDRTIKAFIPIMETRFAPHEVCARVQDVTIFVRNPGGIGEVPWFEESVGFNVIGLARCAVKHIDLDTDDFHANAFTHEVAHIVDECAGKDARAHPLWEERGIYTAIAAARPAP